MSELPGNYILKHTDEVGWWVDAKCGYLIAGYFDTEDEAVAAALVYFDEVE